MIRLFFLLIVFCWGSSSLANDSIALKHQYYFHYLLDSTENKIGFGCGWIGYKTDNLYLIRDLISYKRFDLIANLLDSKTASTRYLAAVTLLRAD